MKEQKVVSDDRIFVVTLISGIGASGVETGFWKGEQPEAHKGLTQDELRAVVLDAVRRALAAGCRRFVVDLEFTHWVNSTWLGHLVEYLTRVRREGGRLVLSGLHERLRLEGIERVFECFETTESAVAALRKPPP